MQRLLTLLEIFVTLSQHRPRGGGSRFDSYDLLHDTNGIEEVVVHIRLVSISDENLDLLREDRPHCAPFLKKMLNKIKEIKYQKYPFPLSDPRRCTKVVLELCFSLFDIKVPVFC